MNEEISVKTNEIDILGRDKFVDNCRLLIDTVFNTTKSAFIMIDGKWGVGKTFVMNMLDKNLRNDYNVIKYNCWENSYYSDPLEAILSVMLDVIDEQNIWSNEDKKKFKALGMIALNLLSLGNINILDKVIDEVKEYINTDKETVYVAIQKVKEYIHSNEEKIIVLVDEIDRCLPEYAIKTLERLYLLFKDAPNFILVIANDKSKIKKSIENVFGLESEDNYLEKFIDYTLNLDTSKEFKNKEVFRQKYFYYLDKFNLSGRYWDLCNCLFSNINVRHIDNVINKANKIHLITFGNDKPLDHILMAELLIIELKELSTDIISFNTTFIKKEYPVLYEYLENLMQIFTNKYLIEYGYLCEYSCFWYLSYITAQDNHEYFSNDFQYNQDVLSKLKQFYNLALVIE